MSTVKRQHYVPQSYLHRFARDGKLYAFDKPGVRSYPTNVRDIAADRFFYDLPELDALAGQQQVLEKYFHSFEQAGNQAIERILTAASIGVKEPFSKDARIDLAIFLAVQYLRTKETRALLVEANEAIYKELFVRHLQKKEPELAKYSHALKLETLPDRQIALHASVLLDDSLREELAEKLFLRSWVLMHNGANEPLYTSDHPVVSHSPLLSRDYGRGGLLSPAAEVTFPLSSRYTLALLDPLFYPNASGINGSVQELREENATYYNHLQVKYSYRQVYCEEQKFGLAEEMVEEAPELGNPLVSRVGVR